jgi:hypothetical protein
MALICRFVAFPGPHCLGQADGRHRCYLSIADAWHQATAGAAEGASHPAAITTNETRLYSQTGSPSSKTLAATAATATATATQEVMTDV